MNIGFFTDVYLPQINGIATSIDALAQALEMRGHKVYIIAPKYPGYKDKRKNVIRLHSVKVNNNPEFRLATFVPEGALMRVSKIDFDIVHGFVGGTVASLGLIVARIKKIPYVFTYNTRYTHYTHYIWKGRIIKPKMAERAIRIFANRCDYLIAPSQLIKEELLSFGVKRPIITLPNGVDLQLFAKRERGYLRKRLHIPDNEKILLYVGRLGKEKSIDFLITAFKKITEHDKHVSLVLVGEGPEHKSLSTMVKHLQLEDKVYFTGFIDPQVIPKVYADAEVFVFSSQTETQGLVIIESLASGLPIVAVKDSVFHGVIKHKVNGLLVKPDYTLFAEHVISLLEKKIFRDKLAKQGVLTAHGYSLETNAKSFENVYKKLILQKQLPSQTNLLY